MLGKGNDHSTLFKNMQEDPHSVQNSRYENEVPYWLVLAKDSTSSFLGN
jgi:hypothetical protein